MTDRYEKIRQALAMGPTPGPWEALSNFVRTHPQGEMGGFLVAECPANIGRRLEDAAHIAACDPDTIRELLAERDALAAENEHLRTSAVSWSLEASKYAKKLDKAREREARQAERLRLAARAALAKENSND